MRENEQPTIEWPSAAPADLGIDAQKLAELDMIIPTEYSSINAVVLVRNGFLAYERNFNGCSPEEPHHIASVTKSILSALVGIAIDVGFISSVDEKVLHFFPEFMPAAEGGQLRELTLRHLLTMTAAYPFPDGQEPLDQLCMQPDWTAYTLGLLGSSGRAGTFKYCTAGTHLLSAILTRSTGQSARKFANERLFRPLGMREIPDYAMQGYEFEDLFGSRVRGWVTDPAGISTGGWGLTLVPRDMARFGQLYLNRGVWAGRQVIPESWIQESTAMNSNKYGYLWWLIDEEGISGWMAWGDGGQVICCIPQLDLTAVIVSGFSPNPPELWALIREQILPAVRGSA